MGECPGGCRRPPVLGGIRNGDWVVVMATFFLFFLAVLLGAALAVIVFFLVIEQIIEGGFDE